MSTVSELYAPQIEALRVDLRSHETAWAGWRDRMSRYKLELDEATRELRRKHDIDTVEAGLAAERGAIAGIEAQLFRLRCCMVVGTIDLLLRADSGHWKDTRSNILYNFDGIEFSDPDLAGRDRYVQAYHEYARAVQDPGWWAEAAPKPDEGGRTWLTDGTVGTGIHKDLISEGMYAFLTYADNELRVLGGRWAAEWLSDAAMDREKRRALYEAMKAEFEPEAGKKR